MLDVIQYPSSILQAKCRDITKEEFHLARHRLSQLIEQMAESMYVNSGIGLAAPQVGNVVRVIVVDVEDGKNLIALINPRIVSASKDTSVLDEGCLSLSDITVPVKRSNSCVVEFRDVDDVEQTIDCSGLFARVIQHEIDHLDGRTLLDVTSSINRNIAVKKLRQREVLNRESI